MFPEREKSYPGLTSSSLFVCWMEQSGFRTWMCAEGPSLICFKSSLCCQVTLKLRSFLQEHEGSKWWRTNLYRVFWVKIFIFNRRSLKIPAKGQTSSQMRWFMLFTSTLLLSGASSFLGGMLWKYLLTKKKRHDPKKKGT